MSIVQPGGSADVPEIPDGLYKAKITKVEDRTLEEPDAFGNTEKVIITYSFKDTDGVDQVLDPQVNRKWGDKATLFHIAIAAGCNVQPNAPFDTEDLISKEVNILVETLEEGKWPRIKSWGRVNAGKKASASSQRGPAGTATAVDAFNIEPVDHPFDEPDFDGFWRRVRAIGLDNAHIAGMVGDLRNLVKMQQPQLDKLLAELGA